MIGACGDWCLGARVEAAFDSGRAMGETMAEALAEILA
jgi:predicted NAD/FAD-dependent oxidoreductase